MAKNRITVNAAPVADHYALPNEKIIEVSSPGGGCLIAVTERDGKLIINVYRADPTVTVHHE